MPEHSLSPVEFRSVTFAYETDPILADLTLALPPGVTSLVGPNGTGKSTFLVLASGRLLPQAGEVLLEGQPTSGLDDQERSRLCSLVFQNMEFESDEPAGQLLEQVFTQGYLDPQAPGILAEVQTVFELQKVLGRPTRALSKGEMQRLIMAFAVLYGSRVVVMDEPVFALEEKQKHRALEFLSVHARSTGTTFLYCAHELDLHRSFSDHVVLFSKGAPPRLGTPDDMLSRESLEAAYQVPYALLHQKEELHRQMLVRMAEGTPRD